MERPSTDDIINCMHPGSLVLQKRERTVLIKKITIRALVILATAVLLSYCTPCKRIYRESRLGVDHYVIKLSHFSNFDFIIADIITESNSDNRGKMRRVALYCRGLAHSDISS